VVDFRAVDTKKCMLRQVYRHPAAGGLEDDSGFAEFRAHNGSWLPDFALFMASRTTLAVGLGQLAGDIRLRREALQRHLLHREIMFQEFCQWLFFRQWGRLRWELSKLDVEIVGDVPIYVTHDSADVWANAQLFKLDEDGQPFFVAGVPPDYFSKTGQRWGNPVFDWEACRAEASPGGSGACATTSACSTWCAWTTSGALPGTGR
jgi:4-alpha-glucanotransferase